MIHPDLPGRFGHLQDMLRELVRDQPEDAVQRPLDPHLGCLGWQLGEAVYRETYWLREILGGEDDLTTRVRHLFANPALSLAEGCALLPPAAHLLHWAEEIQQENLRRLATPGALPEHPLLLNDRLPWLLLQWHALTFERMLALKRLRQLARAAADYRVQTPMVPNRPNGESVLINQGHYRIGSRQDPFAFDNELPPQGVELSGFRIARRPVTNAEYLAFMDADGYANPAWWPGGEPDAWSRDRAPAPLGWRRDAAGAWYEIGLNGPCALLPDRPVAGLDRSEAMAYAAWASSLGGAHAGAVLQHEYQWEVAARAGHFADVGRVWEWCANPFHPYPEFAPFPDAVGSRLGFERQHGVLRGGAPHTQRCLRRASLRRDAPSDSRTCFAGLRLVFPP